MPSADVDRLSKMIPTPRPAGPSTSDGGQSRIQERLRPRPERAQIIDTARRLEGISRHASVHAAGVIISHDPLVEYTPLTRSAMAARSRSIRRLCGEDRLVEDGLPRSDQPFHSRSGGEKSIRRPARRWTSTNCPWPTPRSLRDAGQWRVRGRVPVELPQMRRYVQELKPTRCATLPRWSRSIVPARWRHIPRFVRRKHGLEEIEYPHPWLKDLLEETYGVIVYQDQVMQIAQVIAGLHAGPGGHPASRHGQKKKEEMVKQRENFLKARRPRASPRRRRTRFST